MHIILTVGVLIFIIFGLMKCEGEFPNQVYYKKNVTNAEYKEVLEDCENSRNSAIDRELYTNPKNYSYAGNLGDYIKDECFKEKGFIKGGSISDDASKQLPAPIVVAAPTENIKDVLNKYVTELVENTKGNIFEPAIKETGAGYYVIKIKTADPALMAENDVDKDPKAYDRNIARTTAWDIKFCTQKLKSIITTYKVSLVTGDLVDSKKKETQALSLCSASTTSIEDNLNNIQYMMDKMDSLKH